MTDPDRKTLGKAWGLIVHDLRNPAATISANLAFVRDVMPADSVPADVLEALGDINTAVDELMLGLEQVGWLARWLVEEPVEHAADADVAVELEQFANSQSLPLKLQVPPGKLLARGGSALNKLLRVLVANSAYHAPERPVRLVAEQTADEIVVELHDSGAALSAELRDRAFTLEGQHQLKGRSDGRYGRVLGLFAAAKLAECIDAELQAEGTPGDAIFRIRLKRA